MPSPPPPRAGEALAVTLGLLACLALFFRAQLLDGFTLLLGDRHDGVIALSIMEHWRNVLRGTAEWSRTAYFHPVPGTLGYNDGYLLFGLPYAGWRGLGADPFLAGELTNMTLRALGFLGAHWAGKRLLGLAWPWALLGAALFTLANNLAIRGSHAQLFIVSLAPLLAVAAHGAVLALLKHRRGALLGWGAAFLLGFAAWLMSGFYMAWFAVFFSAALLPCWLLVAGAARRRALGAALLAAWPALLALGGLAVAVNLPFLLLYLPKAAETGMHPWAMVAQYLPTPLDMIHVGEGNYLWGWLVRALNAAFRPDMPFWSERMTGLPPGLVALFLLACIWAFRGGPERDPSGLRRALALATLLTWLLTIRFGEHSLWWLVFQGVPGARATRVVARYQIFLALPVTLLAVAFLADVARRMPRPALAAVLALLLAEQLNAYVPAFLDRPLEAARLAAVPPPPPACRAFYVTAARTTQRFTEEVDNIYNHNTEAMLVAAVIGLPTINGISTFNPPGWPDGLTRTPEYEAAVRAWAARHALVGLCGLDLERFVWSPP
jgi:hypothetical protein